jgi:hypothetical protein
VGINVNYSPGTERILKAAGWFPGRLTDTTVVEKDLTQEGLLNGAALSFLKEFYGLRLEVPINRGPHLRGGVLFDLDQVANLGSDEQQDLMAIVGETGCPVVAFDLQNIFVTPSGRVGFVDTNWTVCGILGLNHGEALEALCDGRYGRVGCWKLDERFRPNGWQPLPVVPD